jgi:hypothetical protein
MLKISTDNTVRLLKQELEIRLSELDGGLAYVFARERYLLKTVFT